MLNQSLNLLSFNTATEPISLQIDRSLVFFLKILLGLRYAAYWSPTLQFLDHFF